MRVWVTKYALTAGVKEFEVEECGSGCVHDRDGGSYGYFHKPYWYTSEIEANAHAEQLRMKKIATLKKQIAKMEKLTFGEPAAGG